MARQTHHTKTGLPVCCEQALKSVGEQNTHRGVGAGAPGEPPARGTLRVSTSDIQRRIGGWRRGVSPAGKFLTADRVVGRAASPLAARCARDVLADHNHNLNIKCYIIIITCRVFRTRRIHSRKHLIAGWKRIEFIIAAASRRYNSASFCGLWT
jgi:hypothetical protein